LALGLSVTWFSLLVLIPLAAVVVQATTGGWSGFVDVLSNPQTLAALRLTVVSALVVDRKSTRLNSSHTLEVLVIYKTDEIGSTEPDGLHCSALLSNSRDRKSVV